MVAILETSKKSDCWDRGNKTAARYCGHSVGSVIVSIWLDLHYYIDEKIYGNLQYNHIGCGMVRQSYLNQVCF